MSANEDSGSIIPSLMLPSALKTANLRINKDSKEESEFATKCWGGATTDSKMQDMKCWGGATTDSKCMQDTKDTQKDISS